MRGTTWAQEALWCECVMLSGVLRTPARRLWGVRRGLALALASSVRVINHTELEEMLWCRAVSCAGEVQEAVSVGGGGQASDGCFNGSWNTWVTGLAARIQSPELVIRGKQRARASRTVVPGVRMGRYSQELCEEGPTRRGTRTTLPGENLSAVYCKATQMAAA